MMQRRLLLGKSIPLSVGIILQSSSNNYLTYAPADDNCYSDAAAGYPDADYTPSTSPRFRYANMTKALAAQNRSPLFQICDWGVDFPSLWAPALGNTWRISYDIISRLEDHLPNP
jgi:hypothetical protein